MRYCSIIVFSILLCVSPLHASDLLTPEYQVKAAYLYNFLKLARFPVEKITNADQLRICVVGERKLAGYFGNIVGKQISHRPVDVAFLSSDEAVTSCHVLFVAEAKRIQSAHWLNLTRGKAILTVGETEDFCKIGGMVRFFLEAETVRFELNEREAKAVKIEFDSTLIAVAHISTD